MFIDTYNSYIYKYVYIHVCAIYIFNYLYLCICISVNICTLYINIYVYIYKTLLIYVKTFLFSSVHFNTLLNYTSIYVQMRVQVKAQPLPSVVGWMTGRPVFHLSPVNSGMRYQTLGSPPGAHICSPCTNPSIREVTEQQDPSRLP